MTGSGTVERVFTAPDAEAEMEAQTVVEAIAGRGLRGDRYFRDIEMGPSSSGSQTRNATTGTTSR